MKKSAGILLFRRKGAEVEVLLVHPGGPFFKNKDTGVWSIPKGEFTDEVSLDAAKREFYEETGLQVDGSFVELAPAKYKNGKIIYAFALEGDLDEKTLKSNTFEMEWPPKSGKFQSFNEIDKGEWVSFAVAFEKIIPSQTTFLLELASKLAITIVRNAGQQLDMFEKSL